MHRPKIAVLLGENTKESCISNEDFQRLNNFSDVVYQKCEKVVEDTAVKLMKDVDGCLTGWGTPVFSDSFLEAAPNLKIIAHSAGSIKKMLAGVKDSIIDKDIVVTNAVASLGMAVAEFTLGMMLMTMKRAWWFADLARQGKWKEYEEHKKVKEPYKAVIGIIAASNVGQHLIKLLNPFDVTILIYDPYLSANRAAELGVKRVSLDELMQSSDVISIHAPATAQTENMINKNNLKLMKDGAILINTARGSIIEENDLIKELETGRVTACLDVTDPEPPAVDSPLRKLPNVILTPHIAGAVCNNKLRNGKFAVDNLESYFKEGKVADKVEIKNWDILA